MTAPVTEQRREAADDDESSPLGRAAQEALPRLVRTPDPDEDRVYERSPAAVLRLVVAAVAILGVVGLSELLPSAHDGLRQDLHQRAGSWASALGQLGDAVATVAAVLVVAISVFGASVARRPRQVLTSMAAGALAAALALMFSRVAGASPGTVSAEEAQLATIAAAIAIAAATFSVLTPPIARWSVAVIGLFTLVGVLGSEISLVARLLVLLGGQAAGAAAAVVFGTAARLVTRSELLAGLERAKLPVEQLERHPGDARGSQPWRGTLRTGRDVFVKVVAIDNLRADQLFRLWRRIRMRAADDERSPATVRRAAEHEAFVAGRASSAGVRTPTVIAVGTIGEGEAQPGVFIVFDSIDGATFDDAPIDELDDSVLRSVWSQVQILRRSGIAHRDLRSSNLLLACGEPWIIDFGFAEVAASQALLDRDLAELLASTTACVGAERAVDAAVAVLGPDEVVRAIPWLQPLAVSSATRLALTKSDFEDLRERVRSASGLSAPELPELHRVSWRAILSTVALGVAIWTLLPQMSKGLDLDAVLRAGPGWIVAVVVASALTYLGAALSISGAAGGAAPLGPTFVAQVASSFTNRVTPARVGGMALNLRFLTKQGLDTASAATGVAVSTAAGTIAHVAISLVAILWAGNAGLPEVSMPSGRILLLVAALLVVTVAAVALVPPLRRMCLEKVLPSLKRSAKAFLEVIRSPSSLAMVLGGSATVTIMNVVAFGLSLRAFGESVPWATVAVVYLAGSALASAAPTPGGLGATEAALVGGLVVVDVGEGIAIPAVLLFRLATFWLPILPGWVAFTVLQRRGDV